MAGPLTGIRVIDFGQYIAGPLAGVMLADQGADVIHVDPPGGPRWQHPSDAFYQRGKRRISLDLKSPSDLQVAQRLIESADVVLENFRPGVTDRLGVGADASTQKNPALIYCSMPGFAHDDPRANMQAWEGIIDAATDNCSPRAGEETPGWDWSRPFYSAITLASNFGGFLGATGVVMGLIARHRTGLGQTVEAPLFDSIFTLIGHSGAYRHDRGLHPPRGIHQRGSGSFRCKDGKHVQFDTSSARHWVWFAREAGLTETWEPDLLDINALKDEAVNQRLHAKLRDLFLTKTAVEWEQIGNRAGAAIGWARSADEWIDAEHARVTQTVVQVEDPEFGPTWMAGLPVRLTATPGEVKGPRHLPDADHDAIIRELDTLAPKTAGQATEPGIQHPLQGLKAVDICVALAGPTCGRLLLEFGADVTKINAPKAGVSGYLNRGKRSILLDLESFEAQQVFWKMLEDADILVENLSPGTADRLGLGYAEVKARRPDIIYTSGSCYGYGGPLTRGRGWERQGQAVAGIMERLEPPAILGPYNLIDIGTGTLATFATGLAVYHKLRTGQGQQAQASLAQTATYQTPYMLRYAGHKADEPRGYAALGTGPLNRFYKASDGWFFLAVPARDAAKLATVEGLPNPLSVNGEGAGGGVALEAQLEAAFASAEAHTWVNRFLKAGLSAHPWVKIADIMQNDLVKARGLAVQQEVEGAGMTTAPGVTVRMSRTPMRVGDPPKKAGSDAAQILEELGMSDQLERLEKAWVLQVNDLPAAWS
jgi:crotonobetainyl-CoA:carnitine CoA-transferase CaiB-like acyl-CoA transferase